MVGIVRHRQPKGSETDRPHLNHRATSRLYKFIGRQRVPPSGSNLKAFALLACEILIGFVVAGEELPLRVPCKLPTQSDGDIDQVA